MANFYDQLKALFPLTLKGVAGKARRVALFKSMNSDGDLYLSLEEVTSAVKLNWLVKHTG